MITKKYTTMTKNQRSAVEGSFYPTTLHGFKGVAAAPQMPPSNVCRIIGFHLAMGRVFDQQVCF